MKPIRQKKIDDYWEGFIGREDEKYIKDNDPILSKEKVE